MTSTYSQYPSTNPYNNFDGTSPLASVTGFPANTQNYPYGLPYHTGAFTSQVSPYDPQVAQVPATSVDRNYAQPVDPSVAPSVSAWTSTYSLAGTAATFSPTNGSHQNANVDQVSYYPPPGAYSYRSDMLLESPSSTRSSTDGNTFVGSSYGTAAMQTNSNFMTSYSNTTPGSSEYYPSS
jgi:hypothetical protein